MTVLKLCQGLKTKKVVKGWIDVKSSIKECLHQQKRQSEWPQAGKDRVKQQSWSFVFKNINR